MAAEGLQRLLGWMASDLLGRAMFAFIGSSRSWKPRCFFFKWFASNRVDSSYEKSNDTALTI